MWKNIHDAHGYKVSNYGNILNYKTGRLINHSISNGGYPTLSIVKNNKQCHVLVHILVATEFVQNPDPVNFQLVNHIDGNKLNFAYWNLEWTNHSGNSKHFYHKMNGRRVVKQVDQYTIDGKFIKRWGSQSEAARYYNCTPTNIHSVCAGKNASAIGYLWRYVDSVNYEKQSCENGKPCHTNSMYLVTNDGRIFNSMRKRYLTLHKNNAGYHVVGLVDVHGKKHTCQVHRLVAKAWIPNPNKYPVVNHIDSNKTNNFIANLVWCTHQANTRHHIDSLPVGHFKRARPVLQFTTSYKLVAIHENSTVAGHSVGSQSKRGANTVTYSIKKDPCGIGNTRGYLWMYGPKPYKKSHNTK
jgi:hypothetical protein